MWFLGGRSLFFCCSPRCSCGSRAPRSRQLFLFASDAYIQGDCNDRSGPIDKEIPVMWYGPGSLCHWCGGPCVRKSYPKTGKHSFCGAPCRNAHGRAFRKWKKRSDALKRAAALRTRNQAATSKIAGSRTAIGASTRRTAGSSPAKKIAKRGGRKGKK